MKPRSGIKVKEITGFPVSVFNIDLQIVLILDEQTPYVDECHLSIKWCKLSEFALNRRFLGKLHQHFS